ncbi:SH3 domain-containing protein [Luteimonas sp. gir]|uniref:C40 family peptidase n=1 Tax=Luteimonas sp. gir TaxID=3127960 RepID=UPI003075D9A6
MQTTTAMMRTHLRASPARRRAWRQVAGTVLASLLAASASATTPAISGMTRAQLDPQYWIDRLDAPDARLLDREAIAAQNAAMRRDDPSIHAVLALPDTLDRATVAGWIEAVSTRPSQPRYTLDGHMLDAAALDRLLADVDLAALPAAPSPRFGLVVRRADLRAFPTHTRVFSRPDDTDIDRFQEDALFPGTPVAVVHASRDGAWYFVVSERYAAWIDAAQVALGTREAVADYVARAARGPIVTGATARTVYTPQAPEVSEVQLEMGVRVPALDWPGDRVLNGQIPWYGRVVELPVRTATGGLTFAPAMLPQSADVADDALAYTRAQVIRQAFKFLGERYGWGHSYNARDCSGFVSEIYRSMGVLLPRNTSAQATSPALDRVAFAPTMSREARLRLLRKTDVGDLVFIPGHVMMVIGHVDGDPYVIHDTAGTSLRGADGQLARLALNGVVVTPLLPLLGGDGAPTIERITSLQRVR